MGLAVLVCKAVPPVQTILQDLRFALRQFRRSPIFTATALVTLALGIGGTTAIFTLVAVMLRSLPVADPSMLYRIGDVQACCVEGAPQDDAAFDAMRGNSAYVATCRIGRPSPYKVNL
jgi:hypothetical protein